MTWSDYQIKHIMCFKDTMRSLVLVSTTWQQLLLVSQSVFGGRFNSWDSVGGSGGLDSCRSDCASGVWTEPVSSVFSWASGSNVTCSLTCSHLIDWMKEQQVQETAEPLISPQNKVYYFNVKHFVVSIEASLGLDPESQILWARRCFTTLSVL